jgi:hypothetical protein
VISQCCHRYSKRVINQRWLSRGNGTPNKFAVRREAGTKNAFIAVRYVLTRGFQVRLCFVPGNVVNHNSGGGLRAKGVSSPNTDPRSTVTLLLGQTRFQKCNLLLKYSFYIV